MVDRVRATLALLRWIHRTVLVLRYMLSLSYREIAELLNWSLPRVPVGLDRLPSIRGFRPCPECEAVGMPLAGWKECR